MTKRTETPQLESMRFQKSVLVIGVGLFVVKFIAWWITDSVAVFSDALESIVNVIAGAIGLYSLYLSTLPRDKNHPYGHGKAEFLSAALEGSLIIVTAVLITFEAIHQFKHPEELRNLDYGIYIVAFAGLVNFIMGILSVRKGKKNNSLALYSGGKHLITDTYTTIGIVVALFLIQQTGMIWIDGVISLILAVIIGVTGYRILRRSIAGMMDEADDQLLEQVVEHMNNNRLDAWVDLHNLRIIKYGSVLHLDCHLTVPYYYSIQQANELVKQLEKKIREHFGNSIELFVHLDPCQSFSCQLCSLECAVRKMEFVKKVDWTVKNSSKDKQHGV
jgi:cation diffusion facilitator family transporter